MVDREGCKIMKSKSFTSRSKIVPVIIDTDMATDCDDAAALAVAHALEKLGEAEILGVAVNNRGDSSLGAVAAINSYFGRKDIPLGAYKGDTVGTNEIPIADNLANDTQGFGHQLCSRSQVPSAVELYRAILAKRRHPDVVLVSIGHLNNMQDLLMSGPDSVCDLVGAALVERSVSHAVIMGGNYPEGREHNFHARGSAESAAFVVGSWPTPILFSGFELGVRILTGPALAGLEDGNPVARAYSLHSDRPLVRGRPSWDQTAVLAAIRGPHCFWNVSGPGRNRVEADGRNYWTNEADGPHEYLIERDDPDIVAAEIESLMVGDRARVP